MAQSIKDTTVAARAFNKTMGDASKAAQDFVKEAKDGPVALGNLTKASKTTELAMKGLAIAGNMLAVYLASKIITSLYELSQVSKEVAASAQVPGYLSYIFSPRTSTLVKELEEFKQKMSETGMSAKDLAKEMGDDLSGEIKTYIKTCENGIWIIVLPQNRATMNWLLANLSNLLL